MTVTLLRIQITMCFAPPDILVCAPPAALAIKYHGTEYPTGPGRRLITLAPHHTLIGVT